MSSYLSVSYRIVVQLVVSTLLSTKMFKFIFVFVLFLVFQACHGDTPTPASEAPRVYCGETPNNLFTCLGSPRILSRNAVSKCKSESEECARLNCVFQESGWLENNVISKEKIRQSFDQFSSDHQVWSPAVEHLKMNCLERDLPAQGVYLNCPAYDTMHCIHLSFVRNAPSSQWVKKEECAYARTYATSCPVCPEACFAPRVPYGSCNACVALPRTP